MTNDPSTGEPVVAQAREEPHQEPDDGDIRRRPGFSKGAVAVLVVGAGLVVVVSFYGPEVKNWFALHRWSESGPRRAADRFADTLRANDIGAVQGMTVDEWAIAQDDDGTIVSLKLAGQRRGPTLGIGSVIPAVATADAELTYRLDSIDPGAHVTLPAEDGGEVTFVLTRHDGQWAVKSIRAVGSAASGPSPEDIARRKAMGKGPPGEADNEDQPADTPDAGRSLAGDEAGSP